MVVINQYGPIPESSLRNLISRLRYGAPQWINLRAEVFKKIKKNYRTDFFANQRWYGLPSRMLTKKESRHYDSALLLAPFDPLVWDRLRFEIFWKWKYKFEAYTPLQNRVRGYYSLPLLWNDGVIGWANVKTNEKKVVANIGFEKSWPKAAKNFSKAIENEVFNLSEFLKLNGNFEIHYESP
jgi:uncharacterized protein YcaQ